MLRFSGNKGSSFLCLLDTTRRHSDYTTLNKLIHQVYSDTHGLL